MNGVLVTILRSFALLLPRLTFEPRNKSVLTLFAKVLDRADVTTQAVLGVIPNDIHCATEISAEFFGRHLLEFIVISHMRTSSEFSFAIFLLTTQIDNRSICT